jgi:hypothetical protein
VFDGHRPSLAEMLYALRWSETGSTVKLAADLKPT